MKNLDLLSFLKYSLLLILISNCDKEFHGIGGDLFSYQELKSNKLMAPVYTFQEKLPNSKTYNSAYIKKYAFGDSDTFIVKGLLSILQQIINGSTKEEVLKIEIQDILKSIGLEESITSQRTNGFLSAMNKIKGQININE